VRSGSIMIDGRLIHRPVSGLERYVTNLVRTYAKQNADQPPAIAVNWPAQVDPELARECLIVPTFNERHLVQRVKDLAVDVYHLTWLGYGVEHYLPLAAAGAGVLTVPDFILWDHPEYATPELHRRYQAALLACIPWAERVLVYSASCKRLVMERLRVPEERIGVVPLAHDARFAAPIDNSALVNVRRRIGRPYVLSVGKDYPHKNLRRLIEAFALAGLKDHALVLAGEPVWPGGRADLVGLAQRCRVEDRVIFLDHVPDQDLPALYGASDVFVYPSLEEGFGLPPLEAMAAGTPVICSDAMSLPEVVGSAALIVDARQVEAIAECCRRVIDDSSLRADLIVRGADRVGKFSWERTASRTASYYREALARSTTSSSAPLPGRFLRDFPDSVPLVSRTLGGSAKHPRATSLVFVADDAFEVTPDDVFAPIRCRAFVEWLRQATATLPGVDVLAAAELSAGFRLAAAMEFGCCERSTVLTTHPRDFELERPPGTAIEVVEPAALFRSGIADKRLAIAIASCARQRPIASDVAPASFASEIRSGGDVICLFPVDPSGRLPQPEDWIATVGQDPGSTWEPDRTIAICDDRAAADPEWVAGFRELTARANQPRGTIWTALARDPMKTMAVLGDPKPGEWLVCRLDQLTGEQAQRLGDRPSSLKLALAIDLPRPSLDDRSAENMLAVAWDAGPDAVLAADRSSVQLGDVWDAFIAELRSFVGRNNRQRSTPFRHLLDRRRAIIQLERRERELLEGAWQSQLEQVQRYQEAIERMDSQQRSVIDLLRQSSNQTAERFS
jgi:glycosyltransferase involved in cell wall biosynthesis